MSLSLSVIPYQINLNSRCLHYILIFCKEKVAQVIIIQSFQRQELRYQAQLGSFPDFVTKMQASFKDFVIKTKFHLISFLIQNLLGQEFKKIF